jgi:RimJ/RimL family protein N-acetyltransferase
VFVIRNAQVAELRRSVRRRFAQTVLTDLREDAPEAVLGLTDAEAELRLRTALDHAERYRIEAARNLRCFLRLCFLIGPNFSTYAPFARYFTGADLPLEGIFSEVAIEDWVRVATLDIVDSHGLERATRLHAVDAGRAADATVGLVPLGLHHAEAACRHALHPDVWRLGGIAPEPSVDAVRRRIGADIDAGRERFAIVRDDAELVGVIALDRQPDDVRLSYWVRRGCWGTGMAARALRSLLETLRRRSPAMRLVASVAPDNALSCRLLERCGFGRAVPAGGHEHIFTRSTAD